MKITKYGLYYGEVSRIAHRCRVSTNLVEKVLYGYIKNKRVMAEIEAARRLVKQEAA